jgi:phage shock protein A
MSDLFQKLNILIRSGLRELTQLEQIDLDSLRDLISRRPSDAETLNREVTLLRGRINDALDYETKLVEQVVVLQQQAAKEDNEADAAVAAGNQDAARRFAEQYARTQQRLSMAESDLQLHRIATQELILRVNQLDAVVAEAQHKEQAAAVPSPTPKTQSEPSVADVLRNAREQVDASPTNTPADAKPADPKAIEADLDRRRQRLTKQ